MNIMYMIYDIYIIVMYIMDVYKYIHSFIIIGTVYPYMEHKGTGNLQQVNCPNLSPYTATKDYQGTSS